MFYLIVFIRFKFCIYW